MVVGKCGGHRPVANPTGGQRAASVVTALEERGGSRASKLQARPHGPFGTARGALPRRSVEPILSSGECVRIQASLQGARDERP